MKKVTKVAAGVVAVALLATGVTSSILAFKSFDRVDEFVKIQEEEAKKALEEEEKEDTENVLIADQYQIRSTKAVSDAYISGNTDGLTDEEKETLEVASDVLKDIIKDSMSDYDKELAIYNWIMDNIKHDGDGSIAITTSSDDVTYPLGVLTKKRAVCAGYASVFRLLANMVGLDCMIMHEPELGHSWDLVKLDDNCWYVTDCYMDAGSTRYKNFNMTKEQAFRGHNWESELYPEPNGMKYCYAYMNAEEITDAEDLIAKAKEPFNSDKGLYKSFVMPKGDDEAMAKLEYVINAIQERGWSSDDSSVDIICFEVDDKMVIEFTKTFYNEGYETDEESNINYEDLDKLINEAFGEIDSYDYEGENLDDMDPKYNGDLVEDGELDDIDASNLPADEEIPIDEE